MKFIVEGFFVSTLMAVGLTSAMLALGISLTPVNYSIVTLTLISVFTIIGFSKRIEVQPSRKDFLHLALLYLVFIVLVIFLSTLPRFFTPDENTYLSSARMGIFNGVIPPMSGTASDTNAVEASLGGRSFWIYLLASFLGSTNLPAHQGGLIGAVFLTMTALASSLFMKTKWLSAVVFLAVIINPLLFFFSNLALNDLALSFYSVFTILFFVRSFSKKCHSITVDTVNLFYSLIGASVLALVKLNIMVVLVIWIILVFILFKYKIYKINRKYKIFSIAVLFPVLIYEFCLDLPYVISVWGLRNLELGAIFGKFLYVSPIERITRWFIAPWWNPAASTLFIKSSITYFDYFHRIFMPESSSLLVSAFILALPVIILGRDIRKELDKIVLASVVLLSLLLFYFQAVSSFSLSDASRYSLWIIPLLIPLALMIVKKTTDYPSIRRFLPALLASVLLLCVNIYLSTEMGGVYIGYPLNYRVVTTDVIIIQLGLMAFVIVSLVFFSNKYIVLKLTFSGKLRFFKKVALKKPLFVFLVFLLLLSELYFLPQFLSQSTLYKSHNFSAMDDVIDDLTDKKSIVFANNYFYLKPYLDVDLFKGGLLLPPPATKEELLELIELSPNNTLFLVSTDNSATLLEYGNKYIKDYSQFDIITPQKSSASKLPKLNLTDPPILFMTFDGANNETIIDFSDYQNDGSNHGALPVDGYYGGALKFEGNGYVSISANDVPSVQDGLTISFLANISQAEPSRGYMLLSKGYAAIGGSYHIFVWDGNLIFSIRHSDSTNTLLSIPLDDFLGDWHHFVFTYNGEHMSLFVDGVIMGSKSAHGSIAASDYDLEIGRDSARKSYYFIGTLDELQIFNESLDYLDLAIMYFDSFALRIFNKLTAEGEYSIFKSVRCTCENIQKDIQIKKAESVINNNLTISISLEVESSTPYNATVLVATDRETKVNPVHLGIGTNYLKFEYPYVSSTSVSVLGGPDWFYLNEPRIFLIDKSGVIFNRFIPLWDLAQINAFMFLFTLVLIALFCLPTLKRHTNAD